MTQSQEIALREAVDGTIQQLRDPGFTAQLEMALPENVPPHRFVRALATAIMEKPELATADRKSLLSSVLKSAQDGLIPDGRDAALIIYRTKIQVDGKDQWIEKVSYLPMIGGLRRILAEYGWSLRTSVVYEQDVFEYDEGEARLTHRPPRPGSDRGKPEAAYALAVHQDGRRELAVYSVAEIEEVRKKSARSQKVWTDWWDRMAEKTPAHRLFKKLPLADLDKRRLERLLDASEFAPGEAAEALYGSSGANGALDDGQQAETAGAPVASAPGSPEAPIQIAGEEVPEDVPDFEGEEPPETVDVDPAAEEAVRFTNGRHEGKTLEQVFGEGKDGVDYLKWALKNWKTDPLKSALAAFAEEHPEIKS